MRPSRARLGRLVGQGLSDAQIGAQLGVCARTVFRWRKAYGISSKWSPSPVTHGRTAYADGLCHCPRCAAAHAAAQRNHRQLKQSRTMLAPRHGATWSPAEDAYLLAHGAARAAQKLGRTFYAARARLTKLRSASTT